MECRTLTTPLVSKHGPMVQEKLLSGIPSVDAGDFCVYQCSNRPSSLSHQSPQGLLSSLRGSGESSTTEPGSTDGSLRRTTGINGMTRGKTEVRLVILDSQRCPSDGRRPRRVLINGLQARQLPCFLGIMGGCAGSHSSGGRKMTTFLANALVRGIWSLHGEHLKRFALQRRFDLQLRFPPLKTCRWWRHAWATGRLGTGWRTQQGGMNLLRAHCGDELLGLSVPW